MYSCIIFLSAEGTGRILSYSHNTEMPIEVRVASKESDEDPQILSRKVQSKARWWVVRSMQKVLCLSAARWLGDRNVVAGPRLWNSLPAELRPPDIELGEFRRLLKTFFGYVRHRRLVTFVSERLINIRLLAFVFVSLLGRIVLAGQAIPLNSYTLLRRMVCLSVTFVHSV